MTIPPGSNDGGGQAGGFAPGFGSSSVISINERVKLGFSVGAVAASGVDYSSSWIGRTFVTENDAIVAAFVPSVAFKVNDWFSVGGGVDIVYGRLDMELLSSNAIGATTIEIDEADDVQIGGRIGLMAELSERTRLGLTYRFEVDLELEGEIDTIAPVQVDFDADFNIPMGLNFSVYHELNDQLALLGDVGWTDWSHFSQMPITVGPVTIPVDRNFSDTWRVGIGAQWEFTEDWWLRTGFSYDSSPVDDEDRLPDLPVGEQFRASIGLQHDFGDGKVFGISYTFMYSPMDIDQVQIPSGVIIDGEYDNAFLHFVGLNLNLSF
jgi:long-chain fatty acid transport protein